MSLYRPSMDFFQQWRESLENDDEVEFHYQGNRRSPPFFYHGTRRDYQYIIVIDGRNVMVYSDALPRIPEEAITIDFQGADNSDYSGTSLVLGYESSTGIYLCLDPRYMRYVEWNDERNRWDHVEVEEGEKPANQLFLEAINAERFIRDWRPPTLEDVMRRTWSRKRDTGIASARRRIADAASQLTYLEGQLDAQRDNLVSARASLSEWGHMTLESFMETINQYRDQLEGIGSDLTVADNSIFITLNSFQVQGVTLGPYLIEYRIERSEIRVQEADGCTRSRGGHWHPHVGTDGVVCWGAHNRIYTQSLGNPFEALFLTADFLRTGYNPRGAYSRLENWTSQDTYLCDWCNVRHNNNTGCPNECGECNRNVDWEHHQMCQRHFTCYDDDDGRQCPTCVEEREADEKRRKEEAEAKEAEREIATKTTKKKRKKKAKKKVAKKATKKKRKKVSKRQSRRSVPVPMAAE